jgi:uncharacterized protein YbbC (DUF1343 family)
MARDDGWKIFAGRKVGLLTNPTGVLPSTLEHAVDVMRASGGGVDLRAIFSPEHGFRGAAQAGVSAVAVAASSPSQITSQHPDFDAAAAAAAGGVAAAVASAPFPDPRTALPVYDTYLKSGAALTAILSSSGVDTIAFDIQDVGARFYTYVWTLYDVMVGRLDRDI